jgi:hydrogenase maturation protease
MTAQPGRQLVIGIGNDDRGDDAVGLAVVRGLRGRVPGGVELLEQDGEASRLLELLAAADSAFLVDAAVSGAPPGTIRRLDPVAMELPRALFAVSSHGLGLADAIELGRALGSLPRRLTVYAIEGADFSPGAPLSPAVAAAGIEVEGRLLEELEAVFGQRPKIEARPAR